MKETALGKDLTETTTLWMTACLVSEVPAMAISLKLCFEMAMSQTFHPSRYVLPNIIETI